MDISIVFLVGAFVVGMIWLALNSMAKKKGVVGDASNIIVWIIRKIGKLFLILVILLIIGILWVTGILEFIFSFITGLFAM